jgi:hypothetical protein
VTRQEIELGIPLESCRPLEGDVESRAAREIVGDARPLCFHVPAVKFRFGREAYDLRTSHGAAPRARAEVPMAQSAL